MEQIHQRSQSSFVRGSMNKRQIKKTNRKLRELLDAYGKTFHHPECDWKDIAVANCCQNNDVALAAMQVFDKH